MLTLTAYLLDGSHVTIEVIQPRFNADTNTVHYIDPNDDGRKFIHLHKDAVWKSDELCHVNDAAMAFVMNSSGQTVAKYMHNKSGTQHTV